MLPFNTSGRDRLACISDFMVPTRERVSPLSPVQKLPIPSWMGSQLRRCHEVILGRDCSKVQDNSNTNCVFLGGPLL